jgi:hypothetical protein
MKLSIPAQKRLALSLLDWHGGQSSGLYAVGSCMLSDSNSGRQYDPANHRGHADDDKSTGAVTRAIFELRRLKQDANFPEAVTSEMERAANALANRLARHFRPDMVRKAA